MTNAKMNQAVESYELTDNELEMVSGGKGRPGGGSLIRDIVDLFKHLVERNKPSDN